VYLEVFSPSPSPSPSPLQDFSPRSATGFGVAGGEKEERCGKKDRRRFIFFLSGVFLSLSFFLYVVPTC
jgi:hypothetical protein